MKGIGSDIRLLLGYYNNKKLTEQADSVYNEFVNRLTNYGLGYNRVNHEHRELAVQIDAVYNEILNSGHNGSVCLIDKSDIFKR